MEPNPYNLEIDDHGQVWERTASLRWRIVSQGYPNTLEQAWIRVSDRKIEWREVPVSE